MSEKLMYLAKDLSCQKYDLRSELLTKLEELKKKRDRIQMGGTK